MYYPFMADWLRVFPREQVMVLRYEDYVAKPSETINNVCNFLDICKPRLTIQGRTSQGEQLPPLDWTATIMNTFITPVGRAINKQTDRQINRHTDRLTDREHYKLT